MVNQPFLGDFQGPVSQMLAGAEQVQVVDQPVQDLEKLAMQLFVLRQTWIAMLRHEGLCLGGSSAINVMGAVRLARELGPGHTIVTVLCDSALRYTERLFNREFLRSKGLDLPDWYGEAL